MKTKLDRYYLLLAAQIFFITVFPLLEPAGDLSVAFGAIGLSLVLFAGLNTLRIRRRYYRYALGVAVLFVLLNVYLQFSDFPVLFAVTFVIFLILFVLVDVGIVKMLIYSKEIRRTFIVGSMAGYLMMAISLAFFIVVVGRFDADALSRPFSEHGFGGALYFSLATITTIGYGDIVPVNPLVRTASVMAGVFAQFYMAVVVAVIVGKLMAKGRTPPTQNG